MHCQGTEWLHAYFMLQLPPVRKFILYYGMIPFFQYWLSFSYFWEERWTTEVFFIHFSPEDKVKKLLTYNYWKIQKGEEFDILWEVFLKPALKYSFWRLLYYFL